MERVVSAAYGLSRAGIRSNTDDGDGRAGETDKCGNILDGDAQQS